MIARVMVSERHLRREAGPASAWNHASAVDIGLAVTLAIASAPWRRNSRGLRQGRAGGRVGGLGQGWGTTGWVGGGVSSAPKKRGLAAASS